MATYGGTALMNRVGHAFFKARMREEDALFGGEVTGHYYFRDNFFADNGFIPALLLLELMSVHGRTLGDLLAPLRETYFISGEMNTRMSDMNAVNATMEPAGPALPGRARVPAGTASRSSTTRGTSTSAPRTRSRSFASTWRQRVGPRWNGSATRCSPSSANSPATGGSDTPAGRSARMSSCLGRAGVTQW